MPDLIAVHWEAAPPRGDHSQCPRQVEDIRAYHKNNGYSDIAYNFLVCNHGQVFVGRGWVRSAATCNTYWNDRAWAVCWMGGPGYSPTPAALAALRSVIQDSFNHGARGVIGHRDACSTQCPGDDLWHWVHDGYPAGPVDPVPAPPKRQNRSNEMFPRNTDGNIYLLTGGHIRWLSPDEWGLMQLFAGQDGVLAKYVQMDNGLRLIQLARMYGVPDIEIQRVAGYDLGAQEPEPQPVPG